MTLPLSCRDIQNVIDLHLRPQTVGMQKKNTLPEVYGVSGRFRCKVVSIFVIKIILQSCRDCTPPGRNDSNTLSVIHANSQKTGSDVLQNMASA